MSSAVNVHNDHVEIKLLGELTFSSYKEFQEVMKSATESGKKSLCDRSGGASVHRFSRDRHAPLR